MFYFCFSFLPLSLLLLLLLFTCVLWTFLSEINLINWLIDWLKTQKLEPKIVRTADNNCAYVMAMVVLIIFPVILHTVINLRMLSIAGWGMMSEVQFMLTTLHYNYWDRSFLKLSECLICINHLSSTSSHTAQPNSHSTTIRLDYKRKATTWCIFPSGKTKSYHSHGRAKNSTSYSTKQNGEYYHQKILDMRVSQITNWC